MTATASENLSDYTIIVMGEALSHAVQRSAPRARLHIQQVRVPMAIEYSDGIRFVDGMVAPPTNGFTLPDTRSAELFRDLVGALILRPT